MQQSPARLHNKAIAAYLQVNLNGRARSYSGRSMYGEECLGFTFASYNAFLRAALHLVMNLDEHELITTPALIAALGSGRQEAMGPSDIIFYFPALKFDRELAPPDEDDDDDDED